MQVYRNIEKLPALKNSVVTIGTFDGVHKGHQQLIERIKILSKKIKGENVLITFEPHPRTVLYPEDASLKILSTLEEKVTLLNDLGIDHLVVAPFTKEFSLLSAREYVEQFLVRNFHPSIVVMGYNHQFGHHRDGNIELMEKLSTPFHFKVGEIQKQLVDDINVSSTRIRIALKEGDIETANHLLGHYYSLGGSIIKGDQIGKRLGFPTANLQMESTDKLVPADGVYFVKAFLQDKAEHYGLLSIGNKPTMHGHQQFIEVYLFDFNKNIYGQNMQVEILSFIRRQKKFDSMEELIAAMKQDEIAARNLLP